MRARWRKGKKGCQGRKARWSRGSHVILWLIVGNYGTLQRRRANTVAAGVPSRAEIKFQSPLTLPNNLVLFQFLCQPPLPCYHSSSFDTRGRERILLCLCDQNSLITSMVGLKPGLIRGSEFFLIIIDRFFATCFTADIFLPSLIVTFQSLSTKREWNFNRIISL